ncbi:MAG: A24 family peptidase [Nitrospinota bacterium]|nr:A24 family peptidase [Nitrospinota bacterium]
MIQDEIGMMDALMYFIQPVAFVLGASVGSFLNVVIHRLPRGESVVSPGSHCPECGSPIRAYDNIPLVSWLALFGLCRDCGAAISSRYFFIELATAVITMGIASKYGISLQSAIYLCLAWGLVAATMIDINHQIIPDEISIGALLIGMALAPFLPIGFWNAFMGALMGGGIFFILAIIYPGGMGGGDIKLMAAIGAILGWKMAFLTILLGSSLGAVAGLAMMVFTGKSRKTRIPFGPFLATGAIISILWGSQIAMAYMRSISG